MSNELNVSVNLNFNKSGVSINQSANYSVSVTGVQLVQQVVSIPTTDTALSLSPIGTVGYIQIINTDNTNYVTIGPDGTNYPLKLKSGESLLCRWNAAAIHVKANTAACTIQYAVFSD